MSVIDNKINAVTRLQGNIQDLITEMPTSTEFEEMARNTEFNESISKNLEDINTSLSAVDDELTSLLASLQVYATEFDSY